MTGPGSQARALLVDIDGVLTVSWRTLPGAVDAFGRIRSAGLPYALLTNTTSRTRAQMGSALRSAGFAVEDVDILTAPAIAAAWLGRHHPGARCLLLNHGDIAVDLPGVDLAPDGAGPADVDVVLLGGAGPEFGYDALNRAFAALRSGAVLVAMNANLLWRTDAGIQLDTGAFLPGLEQAAGVRAEVVGKPSAAFFEAALDRLGAPPQDAVMVGDDVVSDVLGAQAAGISGVLVRTGKFDAAALERAAGTPDHVVDSFADVPALLGIR